MPGLQVDVSNEQQVNNEHCKYVYDQACKTGDKVRNQPEQCAYYTDDNSVLDMLSLEVIFGNKPKHDYIEDKRNGK